MLVLPVVFEAARRIWLTGGCVLTTGVVWQGSALVCSEDA